MSVFLLILKIIGVVVLTLLLLVLAALLLVLLVPVRYRIWANVEDPETHDEFPTQVFAEHLSAGVRISWFLGILKIAVSYPVPGGISLQIFGKQMDLRKLLHRGGDEPADEEQKESGDEDKRRLSPEQIAGKIEKMAEKADRAWRILTGRCGRRAGRRLVSRLDKLVPKFLPRKWHLTGTAGLGDPYRSGQLAGALAILSPFAEDHLAVKTEMEKYRCDLDTQLTGKIRIESVLRFALPLLFDKDCRKVIRKLRRLRSME